MLEKLTKNLLYEDSLKNYESIVVFIWKDKEKGFNLIRLSPL